MPAVFVCVCASVCRSIGSATGIFILIETAATEILGDNDVCDCVEHELNVVCIGGTSHVAVDFLSARLVPRLELRLDVCGGLAVLLRPCGEQHRDTCLELIQRIEGNGGGEIRRDVTLFSATILLAVHTRGFTLGNVNFCILLVRFLFN